MTTLIAACFSCAHYLDDWHCRAFGAAEIPVQIKVGLDRHTSPVAGDHGIRFEATPVHVAAVRRLIARALWEHRSDPERRAWARWEAKRLLAGLGSGRAPTDP